MDHLAGPNKNVLCIDNNCKINHAAKGHPNPYLMQFKPLHSPPDVKDHCG